MTRALIAAAALVLAACTGSETATEAPVEAGPKVVGQEVSYETGGVTLKGYLAYDENQDGPRRGVLVVHEWWGHNDYTRDRARQLAELGYTALAVDMYGDGKQADHPDDARTFMMEVLNDMDAGVARFRAAKKLLEEHASTDPERIAAIGYCFGGAVVLHMARTGEDLDAVAAFHAGGLETGNDAANIKGRVFVAHGEDDPFVKPEAIESFKRNMDAAGVDYEFVAYPGAVHAFTNPGATEKGQRFDLPLAYQKAADEQSWAKLKSMLTDVFSGAARSTRVLEPGSHTWTASDGNRLPYDVGGDADADTTVVLVHCWMCDRSFWQEQLPVLADGYRTVTLDLPGHGAASAERDAWRVETYGEDVAGLIAALELEDVVLVGHSMGGPVSLRAAALLPGKVRGIVAVDTLHDADSKWEGEEVEGFMQAFEADYVGTCENFVDQMFPEQDVDEVKEHVRKTGCDGRRSATGLALMRDFSGIDMPAWFREAGVPIRAINATAPNPTNIEGNRQYADFDVQLLEGVGHYPHMTRPERFNPLMLEAIAELTGEG